jgi:iron complex transport system permease protein
MIALLTNNSKNLSFWIAGGLTGTNWQSVRILLSAAVVLVWVILISPKITILSLGDEVSIGLGEHPNRIRLASLICVVLLSGTAASIGGNIGFVCLIVPQIARILTGTDYRRVIPVSMLGGAVLMIYSDTVARVLTSPFEVPVGSITSLIGVPVFIYLVRKERRV